MHNTPTTTRRRSSTVTRLLMVCACLGSAAAMPACKQHKHHASQPNARGGGPGQLDDSQMAAVVGALHSAMIEQASVAQDRAKDGRVATFADRMVMRHAEMGQRVNRALDEARVEANATVTSRNIVQQSGNTMRTLAAMEPGAAFDRQYMQSAIEQLDQALRLYDGSLIRSAGDGDVRSALQSDRATIERQLTEARTILSALPPAPPPPPHAPDTGGRDITTMPRT